ncbi:MAG: PLP-dependent transferase [Eggerthellaceae bacterium]|nr:PLP-dependent transferase [Eggerthellaceae bacterium]
MPGVLCGDPNHPHYDLSCRQSSGFGAMISFTTDTRERAEQVLERVRIITFAESLGGVESLITYPTVQTHGSVPLEIREKLGITETLLRLSVGVEDVDDLIADLEQALA